MITGFARRIQLQLKTKGGEKKRQNLFVWELDIVNKNSKSQTVKTISVQPEAHFCSFVKLSEKEDQRGGIA